MNEARLLERIAATLKEEVGPAVDDEYPKTQAYMAAVVLQRLARQLELAPAHAQAAARERAALLDDLAELLGDVAAPPALTAALAALREDAGDAALCRLIEALYAGADALGAARRDALLARVRCTLRDAIDRRMAVAR